jgi:hypothetical protein
VVGLPENPQPGIDGITGWKASDALSPSTVFSVSCGYRLERHARLRGAKSTTDPRPPKWEVEAFGSDFWAYVQYGGRHVTFPFYQITARIVARLRRLDLDECLLSSRKGYRPVPASDRF